MFIRVDCYENGEIKTIIIRSVFALITGKFNISDFRKGKEDKEYREELMKK